MKIFVNFLSIFRILSAFAIVPLFIFDMYISTFILYILASISDWLDGFLARKYNVCTKIGGVLDHIGDKLLVVNMLIMLILILPAWYVLVPVILMTSREIYISGLREFLGTQKIEMPVPKARFSLGKVKTSFQMITLTLFLGYASDLFYIPKYILISGLWLSMTISLISALQYTKTFIEKFKKIK